MCLDVCGGSRRVLSYASGSTTVVLAGSGDGVPDAACHPTMDMAGRNPTEYLEKTQTERSYPFSATAACAIARDVTGRRPEDIWLDRWSAHIFARLPRDDGRGIYMGWAPIAQYIAAATLCR
jgi:hypothetical protein